MRTAISILTLGFVAAAVSVAAQQPAGSAQPIAAGLRAQWEGTKKNIRESATFMPDFAFRPP
ncbi:MAG TPA: hypothetical protein VFO31_11720, partial [Vicinamibacterales bacterium]|nr:hypothetical protein [Vicinamibacterales bacterium]